MLKNSKSWDCPSNFLTPKDQTQMDMSSVLQQTSNMFLQVPETTDIIASNEKKDTKHDNDMANGGNFEDTSETITLLSVNEDDNEPSPRVKWPPLKERKKVILYQWTGLSKKPSFLKKMTKGGKEEKKVLVSKVKKANIQNKTDDARPGVSQDKMSRLNHRMESFMRRSSKSAVDKAVSCPVVGSLPENRQGPERSEDVSMKSYFMQKLLEISEQLHMEKNSQLENKTEHLHLLPKAHQHQATQGQLELEKRNHPISAEIAHLQLCQKKLLEPDQGHLNNQLYLVNEQVEEDNVDLQSVDVLRNLSTRLTSSQESASDACTVQDMAPYSYARDSSLAMIPSSAFVEASSLEGEMPFTGSLDKKCCNTEHLIKEITAVKSRQDLLEKEYLQMRRYNSNNNIIMELLREQHVRYNQLLENVNDLQEQQNTEKVNMQEAILFMEEKMAYQSYEQARDIWDELGLFQSRLSKIEAEQKLQNSPASMNEANSRQILYKVMNLLPIIVTNTCHILYGKVMKNYLPFIVTVLLICFPAVLHVVPFITTPLYTTLIIVALVYGALHNRSTVSITLQRSWLVTHVTRLFNRLINDYDFLPAFEEFWELFFGG